MFVHIYFTMLDLKRLRLLRELNARGTIGAVALALDYSPSAVSQQLALLEREAGVPLLERAGRNVRLTAAGQTLVTHADALLARVEEAESDLQAAAEQITGTLRVAAIQTAGLYLLAPALRTLRTRHPALRVEVLDAEPETSLPSLALGTLDLVLADQYPFLPRPRDERLEVEPLLEERFRIVLPAAHPAAGAGGPVALKDLRDEPWAIGKDDSAFAQLTIRACRALGGFEPDVWHHSNDLLLLLALVGAGQAVALLPDLVRPDRDPSVVARDVAEAELNRTVFGAIRRGSARKPALSALRAALRDTAAGLRSAATPAPGSGRAPSPR
jgi:DNA-binding transcriptional LysR family regulator